MSGYTDPDLNDEEKLVREQAAQAADYMARLKRAQAAHNARAESAQTMDNAEKLDEAQWSYVEDDKQDVGEREPTRRRKRPWRIDKLAVDNIGVNEMNTILRNIFRVVSLVRKSDAEFDKDEFQEISEAFLTLVNRIPPLKAIIRLASPIIGATQIVDKVKKVESARRETEQQANRTS